MVNIGFSFYWVTQYLSSPQSMPSSKLWWVVSMDGASTSTKSMTMPSNAVDAKYQEVTKSVYRTWVTAFGLTQ